MTIVALAEASPANAARELVAAVKSSATKEQHIIDLVGGIDSESVESSYEGMLW